MKNSIQLTVVYNHPITKVWKALVSKEAMSEWLMPCDIEAIVGHKFQFRTKSYPGFNGIVDCEVLEVEEPHLLSFTWSGGSLKDSKVTFRLEDLGQKTKLHFDHSGFDGLFNRLIVKKILGSGWKSKILTQSLPKYLING